MYTIIKYVHVTSVVLSLTGFFLRGILLARSSRLRGTRWVRVLPHINDTILLVAALALMLISRQYPFVADWVTAKLFGVIVYIILGSVALRDGMGLRLRIACWFSAMAVFGWIASVAVARHPLGFLRAML